MNRTLPLVALAGLVTAVAFSPAIAGDRSDDRDAKGEAELAKILEGRVAGEPVNCLSQSQRDRMTIVDRTALVFRDGKTIYINRTTSPRFLSDNDYPVFTLHGSSLCRLDMLQMRSRSSNFPGPSLSLEQFIPYTKVETKPGE